MDRNKFIELIGKKLTDSLSSREEESFNASLDDPYFQAVYRKFEKIWKGTREEYTALNTEGVFNRVLERAHKEQPESISSEWESKRYRWEIGLSRIAAIFIFFIIVLFGAYWIINSATTEVKEIQSVEIVKSNPKGQKSTIFLSDGSEVILNSGSSITYPTLFDKDKRIVKIHGEAYFEVEPEKNRPFIVKTDYLDVRVLGTSFNVRAFDNLNSIKVSLAIGQVEVYEHGKDLGSIDRIMLSPGQAISYDINNMSFDKITNFNPEAEFGWKDGLIFFNKASFSEVVSKLSNWYNVDIKVQGKPKKDWNYSGKFDNYALSNVLHALSFSEKFNYKLEGNKVTIKF